MFFGPLPSYCLTESKILLYCREIYCPIKISCTMSKYYPIKNSYELQRNITLSKIPMHCRGTLPYQKFPRTIKKYKPIKNCHALTAEKY